MQDDRDELQQLLTKRDELRKRLAAIRRDYRDGLERDSEEQAVQLENAEVLAEIARVSSEELEKLERRIAVLQRDVEPPRVLMVLTSHAELGDTGRKTGFWLEEFAAPYYVFIDAGVEVTLASPAGGEPPLDPTSTEPDHQTDATRRFLADETARQQLAATRPLAEIEPSAFDAVFYPGGHGPLWDLTEDTHSLALIGAMADAGKPVAAVCHGPAVLTGVQRSDGTPLVEGRRVTGFTNSEEAAVGLTEHVPFLLEDRLKALGGSFSRADDWGAHVVVDGSLVTGQNPASSMPAAEALLRLLRSQ